MLRVCYEPHTAGGIPMLRIGNQRFAFLHGVLKVPYNVVDELPAEVEQIVKPGKYRRFDLKIPVAAVFNPGRILLKLEGMPHWGRFLGLKSRQADTPEHASSAVRLLAITTDDVFYTFLVDTATSCGWEIRRAASLPEALDLIRSFSIPW